MARKDRPPGSGDDPAKTARRKGPADLLRFFSKMEEDDDRDEMQGFKPQADSGFGTDVEGVSASSAASSSFDHDSSELGVDSSEAGSTSAGTIHERDEPLGGTVELPSDVLRRQALDADEPSLSNPHPSSRRESTKPTTLISTPVYRPQRRPPMALLSVLDDDQMSAEVVRIRDGSFVIGRLEGDLVIKHDQLMSRKHAQITRTVEGQTCRWVLKDLGSVNGAFLRVGQVTLVDRIRLLLGSELVRFNQPAGTDNAVLVEVAPGSEQKVALPPGVHWIGTDASCVDFLRASPYLDPKGLRIECDAGGVWRLVDCDSTNHLWVEIDKPVELSDGASFQLGEQRFLFNLP